MKLFSKLFSKNEEKSFKKYKGKLSKRFPICSADIHCDTEPCLVSVVLPVYNCEKYLPDAITSVLEQTYKNFELIIVDDGSSDMSGKIADDFALVDDRIKVIHQSNMKLPSALNTGFKEAKGEFLTWTSADNIMLPGCIELLASELIKNRGYDMVYGNMRLIDENGELLRGKGWYEYPPLSGNVILPDSTSLLNIVANNTIGAAFMYRRGVFALIDGYSDYLFTLEDYDYFMRINALFTIKHILQKKPVYEYRMHKNSLTSHDEELSITASRPKLMELDKIRREHYSKMPFFYADGDLGDCEKYLSQSANRIYSEEIAKKLFSMKPSNIFYINFGNVQPTAEIPEYIPKFLAVGDLSCDVWGYDYVVYKGLKADGVFTPSCHIADNQALSSFVCLKAKCLSLSEFERTIYYG